MAPLPRARPRPVDLAFARPRPPETIAIAVAAVDFGYRYAAVGELQSWAGFIAAPTKEAALLEAITRIRAEHGRHLRMRFLVNLKGSSPLWREAHQIHWWIERPDTAEQPLVDAAVERLRHNPFAPAISLPVTLDPMTVAADGSVRGKHAGFAWLSCTGHYGVAGYRSSANTVGRQPVLVAELLAIGDAVGELTRRRLSIMSDSQDAVAMVDCWKRGDTAMPVEYPSDGPLHVARRQIHVDRERVDVRWAPGHRGEPLNEGADALARLASRHRRGDHDLRDDDEYRRRAAGIAEGFASEFRRVAEMTA
ncbi:ribonuclease H [Mycolicibacterium frederiksbergense]|uniref:Ribonuclease H n=1 Tax=Mycolicibacterium frederiksbergense TaxID=117567 RepID=A0A6H0RYU7_9MYCO|nr:ribonuclease H [Mycolicibacterium frederiksbergense]